MPELIEVAPGSPEWMAARRAGVTATDIVTICGLSSTDSAYALYYRKLGIIPEARDSDRWRLGRDLEPIIRARFQEATGKLPFAFNRNALFRSSDRPWQMATIDASNYAEEPVELKSWADAGRWQWDDGPPPAVRAQGLWQMDVMGVPVGHVGVLFVPSGEFRSYVIEHADRNAPDFSNEFDVCEACDLIHTMRRAGAEFMQRLNGELDPPSPDGSAATLAALKARFPGARNDKTAPVSRILWNDYAWNLDRRKLHDDAAKAYEAEIRELIGEAGVIEVDGEIVARRLRYTVKAHQRAASTVDKIQRVKRKDNDDE